MSNDCSLSPRLLAREADFRFHGRKPGRKANEKKLKQLQKERSMQLSTSNTGQPGETVNRFVNIAKDESKPYLVLDGKTKRSVT